MNPIMISIFGFDIRWYSVLMLTGIVIAIFMLIREGKRFDISKDFSFNLAFWVVVFGIIGARLYYCIFNFSLYKDNLIDILKIWEGGLAIHGGILAGFITMLVYTRKYNVSTIKITDMTVVPLLLAQAIGRWGNFFNSEAHGVATSLARLRELHIPNFVIKGMYINGLYYMPTFLFESILCFIGFIGLFILRRYRYVKRGQLTAIYLMYYSLIRFFIESMRTDSLMLGAFRVAQLVSVALFVVGLIMFMIIGRKGRFEDLYNESVGRMEY